MNYERGEGGNIVVRERESEGVGIDFGRSMALFWWESWEQGVYDSVLSG